jgi:Peptidase family C25/Propeptide_C25/Secretion system C-terminal sorting domain/Peptidase family C25, C terminal ig-like domain
MKTIYSILILALFSLSLNAQNYILKENNTNNTKIHTNTYSQLYFSNYLAEISFNNLKINGISYSDLVADSYHFTSKVGAPKLPCLRKLIEVPYNANINVKINKKNYQEIDLNNLELAILVPTQKSRSKSDYTTTVFEIDEKIYSSDEWYSPNFCQVEDIGIMRGIKLARLSICPFEYNPVQNVLRVYSDVEIEINFEDADIFSTTYEKEKYYSFTNQVIEENIFNYKDINTSTKDALSTYPIKYVIVADSMFQTALQPFVEWKTRKGFTVIEAYTNDPLVGNTTTSIKTYLQGLYNAATPTNPAPSFLLIVGDIAQVPTFTNNQTGSHVSDLYYCEYTGDFLPELYYGRFSATSVSELNNMMTKTLDYEQFLMSQTTFLDTVVMISGVDAGMAPTHGNGQINYGTTYYFNSTNNIYSNTYLYPASQTSAAQIIQDVSDGCAFVNYTAHGGPTGWVNPAFSVTDVYTLQNANKFPLMIGNACSTNEFQIAECFGEALLRAPEKGAIGYIGASNSTFWDEDFYWGVGTTSSITANPTYASTTDGAYDLTFHSHNEPFSDWYMTQGQMIYVGNLAVTAMSSSFDYYWEIYHLIGDPSLMVYFSDPPTLVLNHNSVEPTGITSISLTTEAYAYIAISKSNVLYGAALADSLGNCTVQLNTVLNPGTIDIVGTKQNRAPYISTIQVIAPSGPYVMYNNHKINDASGNNNGLADYNESIKLDVNLKNWGPANANQVTGILSSINSYVTITDSTELWSLISANDTSRINNAYTVQIANNIPDQHQIEFNLTLTDNSSNTWNSNLQITANAPDFEVGNLWIDDVSSGNGDGFLNIGETADIHITTYNNGHCDALNTIGSILSYNPDLTINNSTYNFNTLNASATDEAIFNVTLSSSATSGSIIDIVYTVSAGAYSANKSFGLLSDIAQEDFETGDFTKYDWMLSGNANWVTTTNNPYEGTYCSQSGAISHNQSSVMSITMNVLTPDSITFYSRVSSELGSNYGSWYDFLNFDIDGTSKEKWDGQKSWERHAYYVSTTGNHTFTWTYEKDVSVSEGDDCAKVDFITFPPSMIDVNTISENPNENFTVYPNPARTYTNISFNIEKKQNVKLVVFDMLGKTIKEYFYSSLNPGIQLFQLNISNISNGIYNIQLQTEEKIYNKQLIISN